MSADEVAAILAELYAHQNRSDLAELLTSCRPRIEHHYHDNWNGGTEHWLLHLEVAIPAFAKVQTKLEEVQKEILASLGFIDRKFVYDVIDDVVVTPILAAAQGISVSPPKTALDRIWKDGRMRLFLSHVSAHKAEVAKVKQALWLRGVDAFLAHADIEPSRDWQNEIELALQSMQALAMFVTPDFHESSWTDQEVGWALGRGVLVVPVRLGADPRGFAGRIQGIAGSFATPNRLAASIVQVLLRNRLTHDHMRDAALEAFLHAESAEMAEATARLVVQENVSTKTRDRLWKACDENGHITGGARSLIYEHVGSPPEASSEDIPF